MDCPECAQRCGRSWNVCGYLLDVMSTMERSDARDAYMEELRIKENEERERKLDVIWSKPSIRKRGTGGRRPPPPPKKTNLISDRWFITVNVRSDSDPQRLWARVVKFVGMSKVVRILANLDQSGIEDYKHPHVHFYVEYPKPLYQSKVIQVFSCAFTDYVGGDNFVDVKIGGEYHVRYCQGDKTDEKLEIVAKSREYRQKYNVPEYIDKCPGVSQDSLVADLPVVLTDATGVVSSEDLI